MFEQLLLDHPDEILVYDTYAALAASHGNFRRTLQICKKWVALHGPESSSPIPMAERIVELEKRIEDEKNLKQALPWEKAKVSGNQIFTYISNVPEPYASAAAKDILDLLESSEKILEGIFGYPLPEDRPLKIYLVARDEEYAHLLKEKSRERSPQSHAGRIQSFQSGSDVERRINGAGKYFEGHEYYYGADRANQGPGPAAPGLSHHGRDFLSAQAIPGSVCDQGPGALRRLL